MISYYELLGLIKEGKQPEKVEYNDNIYYWINDNYYCGSGKLSQDYTFVYSEVGCVNQKNIEIIGDKPKLEKIDKLIIENNNIKGKWKLNDKEYCYTLSAPLKVIVERINENIELSNNMVDVLNEMRDYDVD